MKTYLLLFECSGSSSAQVAIGNVTWQCSHQSVSWYDQRQVWPKVIFSAVCRWLCLSWLCRESMTAPLLFYTFSLGTSHEMTLQPVWSFKAQDLFLYTFQLHCGNAVPADDPRKFKAVTNVCRESQHILLTNKCSWKTKKTKNPSFVYNGTLYIFMYVQLFSHPW